MQSYLTELNLLARRHSPAPKAAESSKLLFACHNYITAALPLNDSLIVCGTNCSQPFCRHFPPAAHHHPPHDFSQPQLSALARITPSNHLDAQQIPPFALPDAIYFVNAGSYTVEPTINKQLLLAGAHFSRDG